jgi:hypothetical protein
MRYRHALLLRRKGDVPGYRQAVAFLVERWGSTKDARVSRRLLQAYLLDRDKAVDRKLVERCIEVMLAANDVVIGVPFNFGIGLKSAKTYAELLQVLKTVATNQENQAHLHWLYTLLACARLGDEYAARFWLGQAARQIPEDRRTLVDVLEGRLVQGRLAEKVGWEDILALDLLQREIEALLKEEKRE